jgi:hypothetical protein
MDRLDDIIDRATKHNERVVVGRDGEPAVVIMSVQDFVRTLAPPPDWLSHAWTHAREAGVDRLSAEEIAAEIAAARAENPALRSE